MTCAPCQRQALSGSRRKLPKSHWGEDIHALLSSSWRIGDATVCACRGTPYTPCFPTFLDLRKDPEDTRYNGGFPLHCRLVEGYQNASYHSCRDCPRENTLAFTQTLQHLYTTFTAPL